MIAQPSHIRVNQFVSLGKNVPSHPPAIRQPLVSGNYLCEESQESEGDPLPERCLIQTKEWMPKSQICCDQGHHSLYLEISKNSNVSSIYSGSVVGLHWQILYLQIQLFTSIYLLPTQQYLQCFHGHLWTYIQRGKNFESFNMHIPSGVSFSSHSVDRCFIPCLFSATSFTFWAFGSLFKMAPKHNAEVWSSIIKWGQAAMWLTEKTHVSDKLQPGKSYSTIGREFSTNELTIDIK